MSSSGGYFSLHRAGRLGEAERAYRVTIDAQPENADAHHFLGVSLHQAGHPEHSVAFMREAIALMPERAHYHAALAATGYADRSPWVSGVYYSRVPGAVSEDDPGRKGWIEFGRPLAPLLEDSQPEVRRIAPQEGRVVLFPSFFYHETVPFQSEEHRISIAFDAVPCW